MTTIRCDHCNTPIMEVKGTTITVKAKHHGVQHISVVRIEELVSDQIIDLRGLAHDAAIDAISEWRYNHTDIAHEVLSDEHGDPLALFVPEHTRLLVHGVKR